MFGALTDSVWTYVTIGASSIVTEELAPIFGGIAVQDGQLRLAPVLVAITFGGWIATTALYLLGRLKWEWIRRRVPKVRGTGTVALRAVGRRPLLASFLVRAAFGLRLVLPMACGAARVSLPLYLVASLLGSAAWTTLYTLLGMAAGEAAVRVVGRIGQVGALIGAVTLTALIIALVAWQKRRVARKSARRGVDGSSASNGTA